MLRPRSITDEPRLLTVERCCGLWISRISAFFTKIRLCFLWWGAAIFIRHLPPAKHPISRHSCFSVSQPNASELLALESSESSSDFDEPTARYPLRTLWALIYARAVCASSRCLKVSISTCPRDPILPQFRTSATSPNKVGSSDSA